VDGNVEGVRLWPAEGEADGPLLVDGRSLWPFEGTFVGREEEKLDGFEEDVFVGMVDGNVEGVRL